MQSYLYYQYSPTKSIYFCCQSPIPPKQIAILSKIYLILLRYFFVIFLIYQLFREEISKQYQIDTIEIYTQR